MPLIIGTFDVQEVLISTTNTEVNYTVDFIDGSRSQGMFLAFLARINGVTDFCRSLYFVQDRQGAEGNNVLPGLSGGNFTTFSYDVEETGEITSNQPAQQSNFTLKIKGKHVSFMLDKKTNYYDNRLVCQ